MRAAKLDAHAFTRAVLMTLAFFVFAGATQSVSALDLTVNQTGDAGDGACDASCTLRDAVSNANGIPGSDRILFSPLFNTSQTINLTSATLTISQSVTIEGRGARLLTVRRAINNPTNFRIFDISGAATVVTISGMTISNGNVPDGSGSGGIRNTNGGTLTLNGVTVSGNTTTAEGGGIGSAFGTTTILNSTVSGNTAGLFCGGIRVSNNSTVNIANSTVSGNSAPGASGGIVVFSTLNMNNVTVTNNSTTNGNAGNAGGIFSSSGAVVNTRNSIIAGNFATGGGRPDVGGAFASNGNNLIGSMTTFNTVFTQPGDKTDTPANLDVLANNGGQTDTHRPLPGSEAIDAGNNCVVNLSCGANNPPVALTTDQRGAGFSRQGDGDSNGSAIVDIGAFEVQTPPPPPLSLVVTRTDDRNNATCATGDCSLREAVKAANSNADANTITFDSTVIAGAQTINLTIGQLSISNPVTLTGTGARLLTVRRSSVSGTPIFHIFDVSGAVAVSISGITISNGDGGASFFGGGISNKGGTLLLNGVAVSGNTQGVFGGGIRQDSGTTTILNSTVSGNTAGSNGGGIFVNSGGTVNIANSTVSGNSVSNVGGGIENSGTLNMNNVTVSGNTASSGGGVRNLGTVNTRNSIIAGNFATGGGGNPDVDGAFTSNGNNLIGNTTGSTGFTQPTDKTNVPANLAPLANNGGQTDTHALNAGSPAIEAGNNCVVNASCVANNPPVALTTDQRGAGFPRQRDGDGDGSAIVDIGAFEVPPPPLVVTRTDDRNNATCATGDCSLREAVNAANATTDTDAIVFASPLFDTAQTINLTSGELAISNPLIITGRGARLLTVRRVAGTPEFRIFRIANGAMTVSISGMTISGGSFSTGGGIFNNGGTVTLNSVTVSGNTATTSTGGGIRNSIGTITLLNSTVSGNSAPNDTGGGIRNNTAGTVNIANSTVSGNSASGAIGGGSGGGGIDNSGTLNMNNVTVTNNSTTNGNPDNAGGVFNTGIVNTRNSIIAGNLAQGPGGGGRPDVSGAFTSNGNNLIGNATGSTGFTQSTDKTGVAANLAPLAGNGGQTDTHRLLTGSPAIDAGDNCVGPASCIGNNPPVALQTDQRGTGFPRQIGAAVDIGAFEVQLGTTAASVSVSGRVVSESGRGITNVIVTMTDMQGNVRTARTTTFGYYRFEEVAAGETYILSATAKRYTFSRPSQVLSVNEDADEVDFIADSEGRLRIF